MEATMIKSKKRRRPAAKIEKQSDADMLVKLYELLQGERDIVRVFSRALNKEICFINPDVSEIEKNSADMPAYTTRELSFVMSLSPEELQRYHYLKMKLV